MASTYTLISSNVLSGSAASVTFSSIPSTYTDLVLRVSLRTDTSASFVQTNLTFNSDSSAIYSATYLYGTGSAASSTNYTADTYAREVYYDGANATSNTFGSGEIYIPNYTSTTSKSFSAFGVEEDNNSAARIGVEAQLYRNTSAISSITWAATSGQNFVSGSSFYLYGIKNS